MPPAATATPEEDVEVLAVEVCDEDSEKLIAVRVEFARGTKKKRHERERRKRPERKGLSASSRWSASCGSRRDVVTQADVIHGIQ